MDNVEYNRRCEKLLSFIISTFEEDTSLITVEEVGSRDYVIEIDEYNSIIFSSEYNTVKVRIDSKYKFEHFDYKASVYKSKQGRKVYEIIQELKGRSLKYDNFSEMEGKLDSILRNRSINKIVEKEN